MRHDDRTQFEQPRAQHEWMQHDRPWPSEPRNHDLRSTERQQDNNDTGRQDKPSYNADECYAASPDMPDARKLAQDWITLWQSELSAMATDPEIHESLQAIVAFWAGTLPTALLGLFRNQRHDGPPRRPQTADAPRPAPASAAPDARDAEIERLARHVAALERRLFELEHRSGASDDPTVVSDGPPGWTLGG